MGYIPGVTRTEVVGQQRGQQLSLKKEVALHFHPDRNLKRPCDYCKSPHVAKYVPLRIYPWVVGSSPTRLTDSNF